MAKALTNWLAFCAGVMLVAGIAIGMDGPPESAHVTPIKMADCNGR